MKILVTGGAGFLGQQLTRALLDRGSLRLAAGDAKIDRIVCFDQTAGALQDPRVEYVTGDIADPATVRRLVDADTAVVVHLAAVVSGGAEADFDLGMRVNLDGTRLLLETCRAVGHQPRVLFASSIAVFGGDLPPVVTDATTPTPQGSYGIQKLIGELLVQDFSRKGYVDGRSVRVPTVVVRPGRPNAAASGFASGIIREPLSGVEAILPVEPSTKMWVASPRAVVKMFLHALELTPQDWGWNRSLNLPGLVVSMEEELAALREAAGEQAVALVRHQPDEAVLKLVRTWAATFDTSRALAMGFRADADFAAIVRAYIEDNPDAIRLPGVRR
ncbi:NAD-dependent epimerase/dehydratase family protein [Burkholderiaceae bacterium FT117]|uniref:D-erythronate dehydrogenase n=1 Tax=Zeimonas sediminis TaxID=2944268 RepID=UPI002342F377|nr:D-erythronate dehydrogenase [Zeimonas sediminis]MCM5570793.1 NAD-dependent epimerase/dehydratase family protein [Zeimonas sediminis]